MKTTRGWWLRWARLLLRFLQFAFASIALATLSGSFVVAQYFGYASMLGSSEATYATLVTYTAMLVALYLLLPAGLLGLCSRPSHMLEQVLDLLLAVTLAVAAIVLLVSDYVAHCSVYGYMLRCGNLDAAVVFSFLTMAAHLVSLVLNCCEDSEGPARQRECELPQSPGADTGGVGPIYRADATPTGVGTPKGASTQV